MKSKKIFTLKKWILAAAILVATGATAALYAPPKNTDADALRKQKAKIELKKTAQDVNTAELRAYPSAVTGKTGNGLTTDGSATIAAGTNLSIDATSSASGTWTFTAQPLTSGAVGTWVYTYSINGATPIAGSTTEDGNGVKFTNPTGSGTWDDGKVEVATGTYSNTDPIEITVGYGFAVTATWTDEEILTVVEDQTTLALTSTVPYATKTVSSKGEITLKVTTATGYAPTFKVGSDDPEAGTYNAGSGSPYWTYEITELEASTTVEIEAVPTITATWTSANISTVQAGGVTVTKDQPFPTDGTGEIDLTVTITSGTSTKGVTVTNLTEGATYVTEETTADVTFVVTIGSITEGVGFTLGYDNVNTVTATFDSPITGLTALTPKKTLTATGAFKTDADSIQLTAAGTFTTPGSKIVVTAGPTGVTAGDVTIDQTTHVIKITDIDANATLTLGYEKGVSVSNETTGTIETVTQGNGYVTSTATTYEFTATLKGDAPAGDWGVKYLDGDDSDEPTTIDPKPDSSPVPPYFEVVSTGGNTYTITVTATSSDYIAGFAATDGSVKFQISYTKTPHFPTSFTTQAKDSVKQEGLQITGSDASWSLEGNATRELPWGTFEVTFLANSSNDTIKTGITAENITLTNPATSTAFTGDVTIVAEGIADTINTVKAVVGYNSLYPLATVKNGTGVSATGLELEPNEGTEGQFDLSGSIVEADYSAEAKVILIITDKDGNVIPQTGAGIAVSTINGPASGSSLGFTGTVTVDLNDFDSSIKELNVEVIYIQPHFPTSFATVAKDSVKSAGLQITKSTDVLWNLAGEVTRVLPWGKFEDVVFLNEDNDTIKTGISAANIILTSPSTSAAFTGTITIVPEGIADTIDVVTAVVGYNSIYPIVTATKGTGLNVDPTPPAPKATPEGEYSLAGAVEAWVDGKTFAFVYTNQKGDTIPAGHGVTASVTTPPTDVAVTFEGKVVVDAAILDDSITTVNVQVIYKGYPTVDATEGEGVVAESIVVGEGVNGTYPITAGEVTTRLDDATFSYVYLNQDLDTIPDGHGVIAEVTLGGGDSKNFTGNINVNLALLSDTITDVTVEISYKSTTPQPTYPTVTAEAGEGVEDVDATTTVDPDKWDLAGTVEGYIEGATFSYVYTNQDEDIIPAGEGVTAAITTVLEDGDVDFTGTITIDAALLHDSITDVNVEVIYKVNTPPQAIPVNVVADNDKFQVKDAQENVTPPATYTFKANLTGGTKEGGKWTVKYAQPTDSVLVEIPEGGAAPLHFEVTRDDDDSLFIVTGLTTAQAYDGKITLSVIYTEPVYKLELTATEGEVKVDGDVVTEVSTEPGETTVTFDYFPDAPAPATYRVNVAFTTDGPVADSVYVAATEGPDAVAAHYQITVTGLTADNAATVSYVVKAEVAIGLSVDPVGDGTIEVSGEPAATVTTTLDGDATFTFIPTQYSDDKKVVVTFEPAGAQYEITNEYAVDSLYEIAVSKAVVAAEAVVTYVDITIPVTVSTETTDLTISDDASEVTQGEDYTFTATFDAEPADGKWILTYGPDNIAIDSLDESNPQTLYYVVEDGTADFAYDFTVTGITEALATAAGGTFAINVEYNAEQVVGVEVIAAVSEVQISDDASEVIVGEDYTFTATLDGVAAGGTFTLTYLDALAVETNIPEGADQGVTPYFTKDGNTSPYTITIHGIAATPNLFVVTVNYQAPDYYPTVSATNGTGVASAQAATTATAGSYSLTGNVTSRLNNGSFSYSYDDGEGNPVEGVTASVTLGASGTAFTGTVSVPANLPIAQLIVTVSYQAPISANVEIVANADRSVTSVTQGTGTGTPGQPYNFTATPASGLTPAYEYEFKFLFFDGGTEQPVNVDAPIIGTPDAGAYPITFNFPYNVQGVLNVNVSYVQKGKPTVTSTSNHIVLGNVTITETPNTYTVTTTSVSYQEDHQLRYTAPDGVTVGANPSTIAEGTESVVFTVTTPAGVDPSTVTVLISYVKVTESTSIKVVAKDDEDNNITDANIQAGNGEVTNGQYQFTVTPLIPNGTLDVVVTDDESEAVIAATDETIEVTETDPAVVSVSGPVNGVYTVLIAGIVYDEVTATVSYVNPGLTYTVSAASGAPIQVTSSGSPIAVSTGEITFTVTLNTGTAAGGVFTYLFKDAAGNILSAPVATTVGPTAGSYNVTVKNIYVTELYVTVGYHAPADLAEVPAVTTPNPVFTYPPEATVPVDEAPQGSLVVAGTRPALTTPAGSATIVPGERVTTQLGIPASLVKSDTTTLTITFTGALSFLPPLDIKNVILTKTEIKIVYVFVSSTSGISGTRGTTLRAATDGHAEGNFVYSPDESTIFIYLYDIDVDALGYEESDVTVTTKDEGFELGSPNTQIKLHDHPVLLIPDNGVPSINYSGYFTLGGDYTIGELYYAVGTPSNFKVYPGYILNSEIARLANGENLYFALAGAGNPNAVFVYKPKTYSDVGGGDGGSYIPSLPRNVFISATASSEGLINFNPVSGQGITTDGNFQFTVTPTTPLAGYVIALHFYKDWINVSNPPTYSGHDTPDENGVFTITLTNIKVSDLQVVVEYRQGAVGNANVDADKVWANNGTLFISSTGNGIAKVYSIAGSLVKTVKLDANTVTTAELPQGTYIVALPTGKTAKVNSKY
jgi:hypothetical protein